MRRNASIVSSVHWAVSAAKRLWVTANADTDRIIPVKAKKAYFELSARSKGVLIAATSPLAISPPIKSHRHDDQEVVTRV